MVRLRLYDILALLPPKTYEGKTVHSFYLFFFSELYIPIYLSNSFLLVQAASTLSWGSWWQSSLWQTTRPTPPPPCCARSVTTTTAFSWVHGFRRLTTNASRIKWVKSSIDVMNSNTSISYENEGVLISSVNSCSPTVRPAAELWSTIPPPSTCVFL